MANTGTGLEIFANNASATVTSGGTTAPAAGTVESWTISGSTLPSVSSTATPKTFCYVTDALSNTEKILVTNISGATATVTRGADGSTPVGHTAGFTIQQVLTRASAVALQSPSWLNVVAQFGADPTGVADSTTAISNAITAAGTGGGTVYLPAGTYKISSALALSQNIILRGDGQNSTVISQSSTSANGITISGATVQNVQILDLQVAGPNSGTGVGISASSNSGLNPVTSLVIRNVIVVSFGSHGLQLEGPVVSTFDNVTSEDNLGRGWYLYGVNGNNPATSCTLISCFSNGNALESFYLADCNYMAANGCAVDGGAAGWVLAGCSSVVLNGCSAENVVAAHSLDGTSFKITTDGTSGCNGVVLNGCYCIGNKAVGFWVTGSSQNINLIGAVESSPLAGATASIKTDTGTVTTLNSWSVSTATSFASQTTNQVNDGAGNQTIAGTNFFNNTNVYGLLTLESGAGTNTAPAATVTTPTPSTGVAFQPSTSFDVILYIAVQTSAALSVAIGPTSTPANTICPSKSYALSLLTFRIPKSWYVTITGTIADLTLTQVTC